MRVDHGHAAEDQRAEAAAADRGARSWRRRSRSPWRCEAAEDRRQRQRQLDVAQPLARRHARSTIAASRIERIDAVQMPVTVFRTIGSRE